ncbi:hypothetical protein F5887DRAFT_1078905 [Amanita rubescens]|nr:hypothetical protein F5887DRAFT_1078905 [Amanita rubescens]
MSAPELSSAPQPTSLTTGTGSNSHTPFTFLSSINDTSARRSSSRYEYCAQSSRFIDDGNSYNIPGLNDTLIQDIDGRAVIVTEHWLSTMLFPDDAFGFPISAKFMGEHFQGKFLNDSNLIDPDNFADESRTSVFLNRMISTITCFLRTRNQSNVNDIRPLRYFTAIHSTKPVLGSAMKRKPDLMLIRLAGDGIISNKSLYWHDAQGLVEQTLESRVPIRMTESIISKAYLTFCAQPERDFVTTLCITREGFRVIVVDHTGSVETELISFADRSSTIPFIRVVMGLAFLPDKYIGIDTTIIRRVRPSESGTKFEEQYPPYNNKFSTLSVVIDTLNGPIPSWRTPNPLAITTEPAPAGFDKNICSVSIDSTVYRVISIIFESKSLIGRSTKVFLVELPDGGKAVVKDSWITIDRLKEATFLEGLHIPFGPNLLKDTVLRDTDDIRKHISKMAIIFERRQKRRIAIDPTGVHISDFSSLWELMVALLDTVIAVMYLETKNKVHRDISYTNILLREPGQDSVEKQLIKDEFKDGLGLTDIESMRKRFKCREGLLIDYDYASELSSQKDKDRQGEGDGNKMDENVSGIRTGTAPFIAVELLLFALPHRVVHDLESIFFVLLFICTHLEGPSGTVRSPPLYGPPGKQSHPSRMRYWFAATNLVMLGDVKSNHMFLYFEEFILRHISPYFQPLVSYIKQFWIALHPQNDTCHSTATGHDIVNVFKSALQDKELILQAQQSHNSLGKRAHPGDRAQTETRWDAVKPSKMELRSKANMKPGNLPRRNPVIKRRRG